MYLILHFIPQNNDIINDVQDSTMLDMSVEVSVD